uniref:Uncharacterized protein n=1 Tax=viral metagenome TaxID=1070528 RepID=A0A6C0HIG9_9ZZZZ
MASDNSEDLKFKINDESLNDDKQSITIDLYMAVIYLNQFSKTQMNGGYINIPYSMPSGTMRPNVTYMENVNIKKYKCKNLYIFKATHNIIMDGQFDAELVIELVPVVHTSEKLYLCFLLTNTRYNDNKMNDIDNLIKTSIKPPIHYDTMNFNLQNMVETNQTKIIYKSGIDTVVIFTSPISIKEVDFSDYSNISERLFAPYPVNGTYKLIVPSKREGFAIREGLNGNPPVYNLDGNPPEIDKAIINLFNSNLISCSPVDDNDKTTVQDNTLVYLANGNQSKNAAQNAIGMAFIFVCFTIAISCVASPFFYKYSISKYITDPEELTFASLFVSFIICLLGLILIILGNIYDSSEMWVGSFILILLVLSVMSIGIYRQLYPEGTDLANLSDTLNKASTIISGFSERFFYTRNTNPIKFDWFFIGRFGIACLLLISLFIAITATLDSYPSVKENAKKTTGYVEHLQGIVMSIGTIYGIIALIWIGIVLKYG